MLEELVEMRALFFKLWEELRENSEDIAQLAFV